MIRPEAWDMAANFISPDEQKPPKRKGRKPKAQQEGEDPVGTKQEGQGAKKKRRCKRKKTRTLEEEEVPRVAVEERKRPKKSNSQGAGGASSGADGAKVEQSNKRQEAAKRPVSKASPAEPSSRKTRKTVKTPLAEAREEAKPQDKEHQPEAEEELKSKWASARSRKSVAYAKARKQLLQRVSVRKLPKKRPGQLLG